MHQELEKFAKNWIKENLAKLPAAWQRTFRLMYARNGGKRSVSDAETVDLDRVLAEMNDWQINNAMAQIEKSLEKLEKPNDPQ